MIQIAVFSQELDIHALAIAAALNKRHGVRAHLFATDTMAQRGGFRWSSHGAHSSLKNSDGDWVDLCEQSVIWWRRVNQPQKLLADLPECEVKDFINNEWRSSLVGLVHEAFHGVWVNTPSNDAIAGNKLFQLRVARECGFQVPNTLITQDFDTVMAFRELVGGPIIAKKLMGTQHAPLATVDVDFDLLTPESVALCPAIYQERIESNTHLRVNCFGDRVLCLQIHSQCMDWRRDMAGPFLNHKLSADTTSRLSEMLRRLGLEMGIFDFIVRPDGSLVWLELNTQGQFLFGEGKSQVDLTNPFCDFLIERAADGRHLNCDLR